MSVFALTDSDGANVEEIVSYFNHCLLVCLYCDDSMARAFSAMASERPMFAGCHISKIRLASIRDSNSYIDNATHRTTMSHAARVSGDLPKPGVASFAAAMTCESAVFSLATNRRSARFDNNISKITAQDNSNVSLGRSRPACCWFTRVRCFSKFRQGQDTEGNAARGSSDVARQARTSFKNALHPGFLSNPCLYVEHTDNPSTFVSLCYKMTSPIFADLVDEEDRNPTHAARLKRNCRILIIAGTTSHPNGDLALEPITIHRNRAPPLKGLWTSQNGWSVDREFIFSTETRPQRVKTNASPVSKATPGE